MAKTGKKTKVEKEKAKQKIREEELKRKKLDEKIPKNARNKSGRPGPQKGTAAAGGKEKN